MFDIISGARQVNSVQFDAQALAIAGALADIGIAEEDTVLLLMRNDIEFLIAAQAVSHLGGYIVPVNWHGTAADAAYIAKDSGAPAAIVHTDLLPLAAKLDGVTIIGVKPGEPATPVAGAPKPHLLWEDMLEHAPSTAAPKTLREPIIYTSGTTGTPKGVRRAPMDAAHVARMRALLASVFGLHDGMRTLVLSPLYHAAPASYVRAAMPLMKTSGLVVIHPRFDAEQALAAIEKYKIDRMWMVPTMFVNLLRLPAEVRAKYDVSSLKWVIHSAAPCPPDIKRQIIEWFGPVLYEFYGSTEVGPIAFSNSKDFEEKPGTVGRPTPGCELAVLDDDGTRLPAGEIGEIACINPSWPDFTYWHRDADRRALDRSNMIATGDIGYFDNDGYLFLCDRKSHMIISGGVNIYPAEIEAAALEHTGIKDCAAFGIPDERYGESIALAVEKVPEVDVTSDELSAFLKERLAAFKVPKLIQFHASLPREDSGKIFKKVLKAPFWDGLGRSI